MQIAALHIRVMAKLIDLSVIFIALFLVLFLFEPWLNLDAYAHSVTVVFFILVLLADSIKGQSLGKYLFKIKAVQFRTNKPIGPIRSMVRNFLSLLNFFVLPAAINYILYVSYYRTLGDFLTGTCVISLTATSPQQV